MTGKCGKLSVHLKSFVKTRWNTLVEMLETFIAAYDEIRPLLNTRTDLIDRYNRLNITTLKQIHAFLIVFKNCTKELESDKIVTSVKILPVVEIITEHIKVQTNDSAIIKKMKQKASNYIDRNKEQVLPKNYELWPFFHPVFKRLQAFKSIEKEAVMRTIELAIEVLQFNRPTATIDIDENQNELSNRSTNTEQRSHSSLLNQFHDDVESSGSLPDEIERYINSKHGKVDDLLEWWFQHKDVYPLLFEYFMQFAAIPASSAAVERIFSRAGNILTQKRTRLTSKNIEMLLFLHHNKDE